MSGYTIRYSEDHAAGQIRAQVMISYDPKIASQIVRKLRQLPAIKPVYAVNGIYDMITHVSADSTLATACTNRCLTKSKNKEDAP